VKMDEFENWVKSLPDTVYRMKGFVPVVGTKNPYLFQYAYGMVNWMPESVKMDPRLVIIGEGIEEMDYNNSVKY
jgi:G3E family GTPase